MRTVCQKMRPLYWGVWGFPPLRLQSRVNWSPKLPQEQTCLFQALWIPGRRITLGYSYNQHVIAIQVSLFVVARWKSIWPHKHHTQYTMYPVTGDEGSLSKIGRGQRGHMWRHNTCLDWAALAPPIHYANMEIYPNEPNVTELRRKPRCLNKQSTITEHNLIYMHSTDREGNSPKTSHRAIKAFQEQIHSHAS